MSQHDNPPGAPPGFDMDRIMRRLKILEETSNHAIQEITRAGSLRVYVEKAFNSPQQLVELLAQICVLKKYAEAACEHFGQPMTLETWNEYFAQFDKGIHILPSGKLM